MRLAIFGGTFDPPHVGHYLAAVDAFETLELHRLIWIPAGVQPFKQDAVSASPAARLAMLERMVAGDDRFAVDPVEVERSGLSYTVDTVRLLHERHPGADLFLLIGEDLAGQIGSWRDPQGIAALATVVVLARGDGEERDTGGAVPLRRLATRRVDVSSTEVRHRCATGRSVRGFVTDAVADYIEAAGLYRQRMT